MDKEFFNELLTEGAKELDIQAEIKAAREVFENSEIVRQHNEKMHYLYVHSQALSKQILYLLLLKPSLFFNSDY